MFDSKKSKKRSTKQSSGNSPSVNMLSDGARLKGEIHVQDDIRIAGEVEGDITTKGKAIISASGKVEGNIRGVFADIAGTIEGQVRVSDKVIIRKSAVIQGNVYTKTLQVEEGAQFDGTLSMSEETVEKMLSKKGSEVPEAAPETSTDSTDSAKRKTMSKSDT